MSMVAAIRDRPAALAAPLEAYTQFSSAWEHFRDVGMYRRTHSVTDRSLQFIYLS